MRLVVLSGDAPARHRVILQVQHAVCDGLAAMEFLGDVWAGYAGLEPTRFSTRRRPDDAIASVPKTTSADMRRDAVAFSRFRPRPLAPPYLTRE